jgi:hypothetical protein
MGLELKRRLNVPNIETKDRQLSSSCRVLELEQENAKLKKTIEEKEANIDVLRRDNLRLVGEQAYLKDTVSRLRKQNIEQRDSLLKMANESKQYITKTTTSSSDNLILAPSSYTMITKTTSFKDDGSEYTPSECLRDWGSIQNKVETHYFDILNKEFETPQSSISTADLTKDEINLINTIQRMWREK